MQSICRKPDLSTLIMAKSWRKASSSHIMLISKFDQILLLHTAQSRNEVLHLHIWMDR